MDKETRENFDKLFTKMDEVSTTVSANGEISKQHGNDMKYVRGRIDTIASIASTNAARLDSHISDHDRAPGKVTAIATAASVFISVFAIVVSIIYAIR